MGFLKIIVQVFFLCVELSWVVRCGRGGGSRGLGAPNGVGRKGGEGWCPKEDPNPEEVGPKGGRPKNFALFFPSPATIFFLSSLSLGGLLGVFEAPGPSNVHIWSLGHRRPSIAGLRPAMLHMKAC